MNDEKLRYPIGKFFMPEQGGARTQVQYISAIGEFPEQLRQVVAIIEAGKLLDTSYRPGGWTAQQVVHHLADSHFHAYRRHKRTLLEDNPTLVPYDEVAWAELPDVQAVPVQASVDILSGLHLRWAVLLAQCTEQQWQRTAYHPGSGITYTLESLAAQYVWHGTHHLAHLEIIAKA